MGPDRCDQSHRPDGLQALALGVDALGHGIDRPEDLPVFTLPKQFDRLVVAEQWVGREEPIMGSLRLENAGQLVKNGKEFENPLTGIRTGGGFTLQPTRNRARVRAQHAC